MATILDYCAAETAVGRFPAGTVFLEEGLSSGKLFVLADGLIEVVRGETPVAMVAEPGAIFGEMSILLGLPHTATVRAASEVSAYAIEDAGAFLRTHPDIAFSIARLLAQRLNAATTYLVDLKRQFEGQTDHLGMVGEVLETLIHQQEDDVRPGPAAGAPGDPRL
jgi:CRP/FNR family transcriptional regulator, cyclic AMP receptor protein